MAILSLVLTFSISDEISATFQLSGIPGLLGLPGPAFRIELHIYSIIIPGIGPVTHVIQA